jgi:AraC-like DNA-binding protein
MIVLLPAQLEVRIHWADHHLWQPGQVLRGNAPTAHALWLILQGCVEVQVCGTTWPLSAGMLFLSPQGQPRQIITATGAEWLSLGIQATLFDRLDVLQLLKPPQAWQPAEEERASLATWLRQSVQYWHRRKQEPAAALITDGLGRAVVGLCWRMLHSTDPAAALQASVPSWLLEALQQMRRDPAMRIERLAQRAGFSPAQFRRRFQEWMRLSPLAYRQRHRMEMAQRLLETTDLSVSQIARQLGFRSLPYFTRLFTQRTGLPPSTYRRTAKHINV